MISIYMLTHPVVFTPKMSIVFVIELCCLSSASIMPIHMTKVKR